MRQLCVVLAFMALACVPVSAQESATEAEILSEKPTVQIALLLDTSGSMSGLIEQAKAQLWAVVNEFVTAKKEGETPRFLVALYQYGNNGLVAENDWIEQILPFTDDLDKVSEKLFALTTNGGEEYCGAVIRHATTSLDWSADPEDLKVLFIAGNEPFTQGGVDYREACGSAIEKGVIVNTIFCGAHEEGVNTQWQDGARLADGKYMNIDQNQALAQIDAPQDAELLDLNEQLNATYVGYGGQRAAGMQNQMAQDSNAAVLGASVVATRVSAKASELYANAGWDLVDALEQEAVSLEDLEEAELPEALRGMTAEEQQAYIAEKREERKALQERIQKLSGERQAYVAEQRRLQASDEDATLGDAILEAVREQAAGKGFANE